MKTFVANVRECLIVAVVALLMAAQASAHSGYGYHHGHHGHHARAHVGLHVGRGYYGHHRRHHSSVSLAWYGPLYVEPRRRVTYYDAARPAVVEHSTRVSRALPDMPTFEYLPMQGQDAAKTTADRRRCERQAWRATRPDPGAGTVHVARSVRYVESRRHPGSPLPHAAHGALLGAIGGAIAGDAGLGAAIGAAVGGASWLIGSAHASTVSVPQEVVTREFVPAPGPDAAALGAALMACMETSGYEVR